MAKLNTTLLPTELLNDHQKGQKTLNQFIEVIDVKELT